MSDIPFSAATTIDLTQYQIQRPEKIRWIFPQTQDILSQMKSKGLRAFLRNLDQIFGENDIIWEQKTLTREEYIEWLPYYTQKMQEQKHDVIATPEWYDTRIADGCEITGYFFYKNSQLIGSAIQVTRDHLVTIAFKASDRLELSSRGNSNLGSAIEYVFLQEALKTNKVVSSGTSRNAFGVINSIGYLDFKLRFGYIPERNNTYPLLDTVTVNEQGFVVFFGISSESLPHFFLLHTESADITEAEEVLRKTTIPLQSILITQETRS